MRCPRCDQVVPETAPACPACGADLQPEQLDPEQFWDNTPAEAVPAEEVYTSAQGTAEISHAQPPPPPPPPPGEGRQVFGDGVQANISTHIVDIDPEKNRDTRIVEVSVPAVVRRTRGDDAAPGRRAAPQEEALDRSIEQLGESLQLFYSRMHRWDRITFWVNLATFVAAFLPWRYALGQGLSSGIEGMGVASAAGALLVGLCIYARTAKRRLTGLLLLAQLMLAAGVVAVPVYQFFYLPGLGFHVGLYGTVLLGGGVVVLTFIRVAVRSH